MPVHAGRRRGRNGRAGGFSIKERALLKRFMSRRTIMWTARVALTVLFVYIVNRSLTDTELGSLPLFIRPPHVVLSFLLGLCGLYCHVKRWQIVLRYQGLPSGFRVAAKTYLLGILLAFVTPGRLGELFRGLPLSRNRKGDTVFAVIIDKLFILLATFVAGILCVLAQVSLMHIPLPGRVVIMSGIAAALTAAVVLFLVYRKSPADKGGFPGHFFRLLNSAPRLFTRSGRNAVLLSLAAHVLLIGQTAVLVLMFGCGGMVKSIVALGQAYAFMAFIPFFIANIGIREYSFGVFLHNMGFSCRGAVHVHGAALGASAGVLLMNLILPALIGLVWGVAGTDLEKE
ncbi:MAG: hypothetical protein GF418_08620 [Chitinivibrionales bacterium]|nr:hypothetical protein [Chitinivibrionales bacterium]MBD3395676.1 hypothetical protein [Chitinivibrionales bacterium]